MALLTITTASLFFFLSFFLWCRKLYHTNYYLLFRLAYSLLVSQQVKVKAVATKPKRTECSGWERLLVAVFLFSKSCVVSVSLSLVSSPTLRVFDFVRFLSISFRFQKKDVFLCNVCDVFVSKTENSAPKIAVEISVVLII